MIDKAHRQTDKRLEEMERRLTEIYKEDAKRIQKIVDDYFKKFIKLDENKRRKLAKGKISQQEYDSWRRNKIARGEVYKKMREDVAEELLKVNQRAMEYINGQTVDIYAINYNAVRDQANTIKGYTFELVNADTVRLLAEADKILLPYKELDPDKDIPWNMRNINSQVMRGIEEGESIPKIASRIKTIQDMNRKQSVRTARTIVTGAENKARFDSYKRMQDDGVIIKRKWIATHDSRVRDWHAELDGIVMPLGKSFHNSVGAIMYPGDPSAHPSNVYNCRCTTIAVIEGFRKVKR